MKIFIDIGHPAHVHYFKNTIKFLNDHNHHIMITARDKDVTHQLLDNYSIPYVSRGKGRKSLIGKLFYLINADFQLFKLSRIFKPDLFLSFASPYAGHVSFLIGKPHISLTDTEHAKLGIISFLPFSDVVLTPKVFKIDLGNKHLRFNGFMEQCYLQKNYFKPNNKVLRNLDLEPHDKFVIIRLVSWDASHDIGQKGFTQDSLLSIIEEVKKYAKVFISSECVLPKILKSYQLAIKPTEIHDLLFYAELFIGEGATMASESAILGTPSIYVNTLTAGTLEAQAQQGLLHIYHSSEGIIEKVVEILNDVNNKEKQRHRRDQCLHNNIDVNKFISWFVSNYPESFDLIKKDPNHIGSFS
jgi:hypothetical protein